MHKYAVGQKVRLIPAAAADHMKYAAGEITAVKEHIGSHYLTGEPWYKLELPAPSGRPLKAMESSLTPINDGCVRLLAGLATKKEPSLV